MKPTNGSKSRPTSAIAPRSNSHTPCARNVPPSGTRNPIETRSSRSLFARCRLWRRPPFHFRRHGNRASAIFAHGADSKEMIVSGHSFQDRFAWCGREIIHCPAWLAGFAPQNLEPGALGIILAGPRYFRIWRHRTCQPGLRRRRGSERKLAEHFGIVADHISHECKVEIFFEIPVFNSILRARRLVLVIVIFQRLREPHGGQSRFVKWIVIPAAAIPVLAENHSNRGAPSDLFNRSRQFARGRVAIFDFSVSRQDAYAVRAAGRRIRAP